MMDITWLGHSGFRVAAEGAVLLIDPWLTGNPMFPEGRRAEALDGATHILLTHAHDDHAGEALAIARETGASLVCGHEMAETWGGEAGVTALGMGKGGTVRLAGAAVTMVHAVHSSSFDGAGLPLRYGGGECGFMIQGGGHVLYVSGDTDVMADMEWLADFHQPDIGILAAGGRYTMDMERAAYAARRFFRFRHLIPCHYKTFPFLAQNAEALHAGVPESTKVLEPEVLRTLHFP